MPARLIRRTIGIALAALLLAVHPTAQSTPAVDDVLPFDAAIHAGTLPNGVKYFVRQNGRPTDRVSLRLAVKAGSIEEADDQQGLAHLIEHMAFNGSAHFKPGEIFSYFESVGAQLGPHLNAYTSFDETVYMFDLPSDRHDIVAKGLLALADFAGGLTLDPQELDKERGVVIEEWRGGLGAASRIRDKQVPLLFYQSRYAERLAIGKPEIIRTAPVDRLRRFYDTWYRPERMAVIAVGDVDPSTTEADVRAAFSPVADRAAASEAPDAAIPLAHPLLASVITDPEVTESTVQVLRKRTKEGESRVGDYRRDLMQRMIEHMINDRFGELARRPDASFLGGGASDGTLSRTVDAFALEASVPDGKLEDGARLLGTEARRIKEFGFTPSETERAKKWLTTFYERAYNERGRNDSGAFADEYVAYFLDNEPTPGIEYEYRLVQQLLPGVTTAEMTALARRVLADDSRILLAVSPEKAGIQAPTAAALQAALAAAEQAPVSAWNDNTTSRDELVETKPAAAGIRSRRTIDSIGVTVLTFANGVEAWLKPTDFKNDQVLFTFSASGGASLARPEDYVEASLASSYVRLSGVGGLKATDLEKLLAGKTATASPFIGLSTHGISGTAAPADLETALQLLYQSVVAPGDDADAFAVMKRQLDASVANRDQSPEDVFSQRLSEVNASRHYITERPTRERVAALSRDKMTGFYRDRFANAADFTLFMVGSFSVDRVAPLLAQYVGSLPSAGARQSGYRDIGLRFPAANEQAVVRKGREPRGEVVISFFADPAPSLTDQEAVAQATAVLETALRDVLREELGQTYTVSVDLSQPLPQRGDGRIEISFGAAPENLQPMIDRALREIRRLQANGPTEAETGRAKETARRDYEVALRQNGYWLRRLETTRLLETDPQDIARRTERIAAITPNVLQDAFKRYFPADRYTVVTLLPEER